MQIQQYQKKPATVDASQYLSVAEIQDFKDWGALVLPTETNATDFTIYINDQVCRLGDFIVKDGLDFFVIRPEAFKLLYTPV